MADLGGEVPRQGGGSPEAMPQLPGVDAAAGADAATTAGEYDDSEYGSNKTILAPVIDAVSLLGRGTRTFFEEGAREDILQHRDNGGSLYMLMSHVRRWETVLIAPVVQVNEALRHVRFNTAIAAREELFDLPFVGPITTPIIKAAGARPLKRSLEAKSDETEEEAAERRAHNIRTQGIIGRVMAEGGNGLVFPEGGSKEVIRDEGGKAVRGPDGKVLRKPREPGKVLPVYKGFVYSLANMTPEERSRVKLLGIAAQYGDRRLTMIRPTIAIPRPVDPLEGDYEDPDHIEKVRKQGEGLLQKAMADAVMLDGERSRGRL